MGDNPGVGVGLLKEIVIFGGIMTQDSPEFTEQVDPAISMIVGTITEIVPEGEFDGTEKST